MFSPFGFESCMASALNLAAAFYAPSRLLVIVARDCRAARQFILSAAVQGIV